MNNNMQIFDDLELLVRMCHSKSDGPSLQIEEEEIQNKLAEYDQEIDEIKSIAEEDNYDTSAEMADRNIEIITKRIINSIKAELKVKKNELEDLKEKEAEVNEKISSIKESINVYEEHIASMETRISSTNKEDIINRYNSLIEETRKRIDALTNDLDAIESSYKRLQNIISKAADEITELETKLQKKQEQLEETQENLDNKESYVDQVKLERNNKKIKDLESKKEKLVTRLDEIRKDPKYLEAQIKKILNNGDNKQEATKYISSLVSIASNIPYMNVAADNALEEELLRTTQARDTFANEIDQKSYNILEKLSPEQIRIDYLNQKIANWQNELADIEQKVAKIDNDEEYNYQQKDIDLSNLIAQAQADLSELKKAYDLESDSNLSSKAQLKVAYDEKKEDLNAANKIVAEFRKEEAEAIKNASNLIKNDSRQIKNNIEQAQKEIEEIKNRLKAKKSGMIDISAQNKDKDHLKELAKVVMDIKHRRQFAETPSEVAKRIEQNLALSLNSSNISSEPVLDSEMKIEPNIENVIDEKVENQQDVDNNENNIENISAEPINSSETLENEIESIDTDEKNDNINSDSSIASELDEYINSLESSLS